MHYPETDPFTYRSWIGEGWHEIILEELRKLLLFVEKHPISGLMVNKIRGASFAEGDLPPLFNREVSLLTKEIDAYNEAWQTPVDEEQLARGWKLSGLKRP